MGIEKFFNSLKKSYGDKIINKFDFDKNKVLPHTHLFFDFNSMIHNISQNVCYSLVYLYHIYQISNLYKKIYSLHQNLIKSHLSNIKTSKQFILEANISLSDQSAESQYNVSIDFANLDIDQIDDSFFKLITSNDNLDKLIIYKIIEYLEYLINIFPQLKYLYLAIDGVPLYAKMIEQKKRRTISYIYDMIRDKLISTYKTELDIQPTLYDNSPANDIYYNHWEFELFIKKLKFNKNKISPGTVFMENLESEINKYFASVNKTQTKTIFELDPFTNQGEGEKKIVHKILDLNKQSKTKQSKTKPHIMVYSPDADVILLMLLESDKANIDIFRYDQQLKQTDIIGINQLKQTIIDYCRYGSKDKDIQHKLIIDIVMIFTILGNDFLPKLDIINTNKHIRKIFDAYINLSLVQTNPNPNPTNPDPNPNPTKPTNPTNPDPTNPNPDPTKPTNQTIYTFNSITSKYEINFKLLLEFFKNLKSLLINEPRNQQINRGRTKEWKLEPDQILNINAIPYYQHLFHVENLTNTYEPPIYETSIYDKKMINRMVRKYIQGWIWLNEYYLNHDSKYKLYSYEYDFKPSLGQIIYCINSIISKPHILKKIISNLQTKIIPDNKYFNPYTQLIYISPFDISSYIDNSKNKYQKLASSYDQIFNQLFNIEITDYKLNIFDYLDCSDAFYLNKCTIRQKSKYKVKHVLRYLIHEKIDILNHCCD